MIEAKSQIVAEIEHVAKGRLTPSECEHIANGVIRIVLDRNRHIALATFSEMREALIHAIEDADKAFSPH